MKDYRTFSSFAVLVNKLLPGRKKSVTELKFEHIVERKANVNANYLTVNEFYIILKGIMISIQPPNGAGHVFERDALKLPITLTYKNLRTQKQIKRRR